jgi:tRNA-specific 2-thiouridylase
MRESHGERVIVGMSGGVDSSVTARLLKEQGFEVEGVSFMLYEARLRKTFPKTACCSIAAMNDARLTAQQLGVRHHIIDMREEFLEKVIEPFIEAYSQGLTPNPCILCNRHVKFPGLSRFARERDAGLVATGHYARAENGILMKGLDARKDQSYVLYVLAQDELNCLLLPLGAMKKDEVRRIARSLEIPAAARPESQEICFIEGRNYCSLFEGMTCGQTGPIIDIATGHVIGTHRGLHLYTIGQRKRLGIASLEPRYVVRIDPARNALYTGPREAALKRRFTVEDPNWLQSPGGVGDNAGIRVTVKVRSTMRDEPATITDLGREGPVQWQRVSVTFDEAQWAPAPGQSAVFYDRDVVIGGGLIGLSEDDP